MEFGLFVDPVALYRKATDGPSMGGGGFHRHSAGAGPPIKEEGLSVSSRTFSGTLRGMAKHLHEQAGGNPSQGPKGEMANPKPSAGTGNDFPDVPEANSEAADDTSP